MIAGTGTRAIHSGVPLLEGQLMPADTGDVSLWIGGVEVACYVEALKGRYPDGSVISLLVQADTTLTFGTPVSAELRLTTTPLLSRITKRAITWPSTTVTNWQDATITNATAALVPTSATHWCAWGGWWNQLATATTASAQPHWDAWIDLWDEFEPDYWDVANDAPGASDYDAANCGNGSGQYDRAGTYLSIAAMHAAPNGARQDYWRKALLWWSRQRSGWWENNTLGFGPRPTDYNGNPSSQQMPAGLMYAYWLFGDEAMRDRWTTQIAEFSMNTFANYWANTWVYDLGAEGENAYNEIRGHRWRLALQLWACRTGDAALTNAGQTYAYWLEERARRTADTTINTAWNTANSGEYSINWPTAGNTWSSGPYVRNTPGMFQVAMMLDGLIAVHDRWPDLPTDTKTLIKTRVKECADWLWSYWDEWNPPGTVRAVRYSMRDDTIVNNGPSSEWSLSNGFYPHIFAWVARNESGASRATYRSRAAEIIDHLTRTPRDGFSGPINFTPPIYSAQAKQFSEYYFLSIYLWPLLAETTS